MCTAPFGRQTTCLAAGRRERVRLPLERLQEPHLDRQPRPLGRRPRVGAVHVDHHKRAVVRADGPAGQHSTRCIWICGCCCRPLATAIGGRKGCSTFVCWYAHLPSSSKSASPPPRVLASASTGDHSLLAYVVTPAVQQVFRSCYALRGKDSEHLTMRNGMSSITHRCSPALPARTPRKTASMAVKRVGCVPRPPSHCMANVALSQGTYALLRCGMLRLPQSRLHRPRPS